MLKQIFSVVMTLICMLSIMACQPSLSASTSGRVDAEDYDAFWIWGNISSAPYLAKAKELYILQGEFRLDRRTHQPQYLYQGVSVLNIPHQKVWLVFRNHHLNWSKTNLILFQNAFDNGKMRGIIFKAYKLILMPKHKIFTLTPCF